MIRVYQPGDHPAIAEIFRRAIHEIASGVYSPEQCRAWSSSVPDEEHWRRRCEFKRPFVALVNSRIVGFLELDTDGHIDCAYVHPDFQRRGIMIALVRHAIETAFAMKQSRVYTEASICAKPLFEREGFAVLGENVVSIDGVQFLNHRMELRNPRV